MKRLVFILAIAFVSTVLISCGGSNDEDNQQITEENKTDIVNTFNNKLITLDLDGDWEVNDWGAHNKKTDYGIICFEENSHDDIYAIFKSRHEVVGEIEETTVDGMPAITGLQRFMQNEAQMSRVWLIYDGTHVIKFSVETNEKDFDDNVAKDLIKKVRVLNKGENVEFPEKEKKTYYKPEEFPEEILNKFSEYLATDVILSEENVKNVIVLMDTLKNFDTTGISALNDEQKTALVDSIYQVYGFDNAQNMADKTYKPIMNSIIFLALFENKDENNPLADDLIKDMLNQNSISKEDIKFTYDNWELITEFLNKFEE